VQGVATVMLGDRLHPLGFEGRQVAGLEAAAMFGHKALDGLGNLATVQGLATGLGNRPQAPGRRREAEQRAYLGGAPQGRKLAAKPGCDCSSGVAAAHFCWTTTGTR